MEGVTCDKTDDTKPGYLLTSAKDATNVPSGERLVN